MCSTNYIVKSSGDRERLSRVAFSDIVSTATNDIKLASVTAESKVKTMKVNYPIQDRYLLIFVDGKLCTNYYYRTDGSILLHNPSKESVEVYVLVPNSMNDIDVCQLDSERRFTFHNLRVNTIANNSSVNTLSKTNIVLTHTDLM